MDSWVNIVIRFALYLDLMLLFGLPLFGLYALKHDERRSSRITKQFAVILGGAATAGIALSVLSMIVLAKMMTGEEDYSSVSQHALGMIISGTTLGTAWVLRLVALVVVLTVTPALLRRPTVGLAAAAIGGAVALASLAWGGHGAMDSGDKGVIHLSADILHLAAAGGWIGALTAFVLLLRVDDASPSQRLETLQRTLAGFAVVGTAIVLTLVATGLINYGMISGPTLSGLTTTLYGQLLLTKLGFFALMLALAAANRYHLTPRLEAKIRNGDYAGAVGALRKSLLIESSAATAIIVLVSVLGIQSPQ
ncbi:MULTISPECIES: copper homeostasis membrane protein CopD [Pandoraea]|uniref:Copper resistance D family protein n=2 Tax=Pandoraea TaxID=93217 RepID=A0A5E5PA62_9BURK|nr:copper homeostasis membrane protein CopD [Pandoraea apista]VVE47037.1 copper resistance protein CopD [Pandoraea eparura]OXS88465.1 copper resistance protein CopD [Pandoraea apista]RRJ28835.1 copper resistance D family protein [Pandoraea apista]RRJ73763.1 copper resistance D family protein [Pandoraea apista]RSD07635.1 copper resistance D family protein [Pandoraea apista]